MKNNKKLLLVLTIVSFILIFIYNWFITSLLDIFFGYLLIISLGLIILFILLFSKVINELKKDKCLINIISFIILILTILLVLFFPFREVKFKLEFKLYDDKREEVIRLLQNNKLYIDNDGNCILPNKLDMVSEDGKIMVYKNDDNGLLIGFWIFRGIGTSSELLVDSSLDKEFIKDNLGSDILSVKDLNDKWYYVVIE